MPHRRNAIKALRKHEKRHSHNLDVRTAIKKTVKKFEESVSQKNAVEAKISTSVRKLAAKEKYVFSQRNDFQSFQEGTRSQLPQSMRQRLDQVVGELPDTP